MGIWPLGYSHQNNLGTQGSVDQPCSEMNGNQQLQHLITSATTVHLKKSPESENSKEKIIANVGDSSNKPDSAQSNKYLLSVNIQSV